MKLKRMVEDFSEFAMTCSGANLKILKEQCASEQPKYAMIGIFIFLTAIFASLSGGYALYKGFKSPLLAGLIGLLWGAFIFNVDRFIVSTIRKKQIVSDLPLREKLSYWGGVALRILLAFLISIVISTPLELKYFEPEIKAQITKRLDSQAVEIQNKALLDQSEVKKLEDENQSLREDIAKKEKRRDELQDRSNDEAAGKGGSGIPGAGPWYEQRRLESINYERELEEFRSRSLNKFNENNKRIDELRKERDKQVDDLINNQKDGIGFLAEFEAMNKLAEESESIRSAKLFISFLILMLECTPILMKIMASYGPYDSILEAEEYTVNLNTQRDISDQNLKTNKELYINERMAALLVTVEEQLMQEAMSNMLNLAKPEIDKAKQAAAREVVENLKKHLDKFAPVIMPKNGAKEV